MLEKLASLLSMIAPPAHAACGNAGEGLNLADCLLLGNGKSVNDVYNDPADLVNIIVPNLFMLAGFLLFLMLIFAGFKFATQGAKGKDDAKGIVQSVAVGFIVMFSAYWIIRIIELLIGMKILY